MFKLILDEMFLYLPLYLTRRWILRGKYLEVNIYSLCFDMSQLMITRLVVKTQIATQIRQYLVWEVFHCISRVLAFNLP